MIFLDFISALITILVMWNHDKHKNWWLLYCAGSIIFIVLMIYKLLIFWGIAGICLLFVGIRNYLSKNNITTVYLDLDGVLVNFTKGIFQLAAQEDKTNQIDKWNFFNDFNISKDVLSYTDVSFWRNLEWTPEGKIIFHWLQYRFTNIKLLTAPFSFNSDCWTGKYEWVEKNIPCLKNSLIITSMPKEYFANKNTLLVDDNKESVEKFKKAGGKAILISRSWNNQKNINVVEQFIKDLERVKNEKN